MAIRKGVLMVRSLLPDDRRLKVRIRADRKRERLTAGRKLP